jgi:hypothetical protein
VVFPNAGHGLIERTQTAAGVITSYSAKLFDITADWIKAQQLPARGNFIVMPKT